MDHSDAVAHGVFRAFYMYTLAVNPDFSRVRGVNSHQYFHQCRFTGAVFSHQGVNFSGPDPQIDIPEDIDAGKTFFDSSHFQYILGHMDTSSFDFRTGHSVL